MNDVNLLFSHKVYLTSEGRGTNAAQSALNPSGLEYENFGTNFPRRRSVNCAHLVENMNCKRDKRLTYSRQMCWVLVLRLHCIK